MTKVPVSRLVALGLAIAGVMLAAPAAGQGQERFDQNGMLFVAGHEVYAWHPAGVARSKLWTLLAGKGLGVAATARNWTTVTKLLDLAR